MARLLHHMSLVAPAIISLLLLLLLLLAAALAAAAAAGDTLEKKVGMRFRRANKEEAQWLDRYAETHEPLGAGPLRMVRATPEQEHWLNRFSDVATTDDGEDGAGGSGDNIDFDDDNPYVSPLLRATENADIRGIIILFVASCHHGLV